MLLICIDLTPNPSKGGGSIAQTLACAVFHSKKHQCLKFKYQTVGESTLYTKSSTPPTALNSVLVWFTSALKMVDGMKRPHF